MRVDLAIDCSAVDSSSWAVPFAVELTLEETSARAVRALWARLAKTGVRFMADSGAAPHVTLGVWDELDVAPATAAAAALAKATAPLPLTFTDVRTFGDEVAYLAPVRSVRLAALQRRAQAAIGPFGRGAWPNYAPAAWIPHCTLAMELPPGRIADVLTLAATLTLPILTRGDHLSIVEFRPVRERYSYPLTGRGRRYGRAGC